MADEMVKTQVTGINTDERLLATTGHCWHKGFLPQVQAMQDEIDSGVTFIFNYGSTKWGLCPDIQQRVAN